jgi:hypothetical protein
MGPNREILETPAVLDSGATYTQIGLELMNSGGRTKSRKVKYSYITEFANGMNARIEYGSRFGLFNVHMLQGIPNP